MTTALRSEPVLPLAPAVALAGDEPRARRTAVDGILATLKLPPRRTLSEWADAFRVLAPPAAEPGPWRTDRAPYLREIMDTVSGREYQDVTVVKCSQSGGSEVLLNAIGYYIDQEPSAILVIQPNVKPMAEDFSKDRVAPLLRDSVPLRGKVQDPRSRDSGNTILHKSFPGGMLTIAGANSAAGLASRPIRVALADELDRWPASAGTEGDPLSLVDARQTTFRHRKKKVKVSSPGNEGESRIEKEWLLSDQRHFYVPCPHCGECQPLEWRDSAGKPDIRNGRGEYRLVWDKVGDGDAAEHVTETAAYCCRGCGALIEETHKPAMLAAGRWVKHNPASRRAGFHISGLLSPWVRWREIAAEWIAKKADPEQRKAFFNTKLGLLYQESGEVPDASQLAGRRETYAAEVPAAVGVLTMAIDVQGDRIECEVRGWADGEESWQIRYERVYGDPEESAVWESAEALLARPWRHASGADLRIRACSVDSGYLTDVVYRWVRPRQMRGVYALKGVDGLKDPMSRASRANKDGVKVFSFNPTKFKDILFARLKRVRPGPGYLHFGTEAQTGAPEDYYPQLGAERRAVEYVKNAPVVTYKLLPGRRNEAIDLYNMNLVALRSLGMAVYTRLGTIAAQVAARGVAQVPDAAPDAEDGAAPSAEAAPAPPRPVVSRPVARPRGAGFVKRW